VAWSGSLTSMQEFVDRHGLTFPNVVDDDGSLFSGFGVISQPGWAFYDGAGGIDVQLGALGASELNRRIEDLAPA
jgi:hypothetical protein